LWKQNISTHCNTASPGYCAANSSPNRRFVPTTPFYCFLYSTNPLSFKVHNNYFFLRQLTRSLDAQLKGAVVSECFSQNKDELILRFETKADPFFIKASLLSSFSCLSFPREFHRARKNSVDLLANLIGARVQRVFTFDNERSFAVDFDHETQLLFKLHGNRSNLILFKDHRVDELFKNSIQEDETLDPEELHRTIDWSYEKFIQHQDNLPGLYFTFGKWVWRYLDEQGFRSKSTEEKWTAIQNLLRDLEHPSYFITEADGKMVFSLLATGQIMKTFHDPIAAINDFFLIHSQQDTLTREKSSLLSSLKTKLQASENYFTKTQQKLDELKGDNNYKTWADLIMAHLHAIAPGTERVTLPNFYLENHPTEIKLKKDLSPQKNAEVFYKKSKKQQLEMQRLQQILDQKQQERQRLQQQLHQAEALATVKDLRPFAEGLGWSKEKEKQPKPLPYHETEYNGYRIWVGRNAQANDELTLKYGYKEDLWLHAKDVAGSHVLIKHQSGKNFPKDVIERAAQLAAYHSKRKTDTLCPVIVVPRKFVRKRKGDPAGAVVVDREEIIMVEPKR
jgi:predicted ribosome quality control (RQC) complex YloA/Tae2 family protein